MRLAGLAFAAALASCSPPQQQSQAPTTAPSPVVTCNALAPDLTRLVVVQESDPAASPATELRGGSITPGAYDLSSAVRIGDATGWRGGRAVVISVTENDDGVVLNWAGAAPGQAIDSWTAMLHENPARLSYTCGRVGEVDAAFSARADALELRVQDGPSGALNLTFGRRP